MNQWVQWWEASDVKIRYPYNKYCERMFKEKNSNMDQLPNYFQYQKDN